MTSQFAILVSTICYPLRLDVWRVGPSNLSIADLSLANDWKSESEGKGTERKGKSQDNSLGPDREGDSTMYHMNSSSSMLVLEYVSLRVRFRWCVVFVVGSSRYNFLFFRQFANSLNWTELN